MTIAHIEEIVDNLYKQYEDVEEAMNIIPTILEGHIHINPESYQNVFITANHQYLMDSSELHSRIKDSLKITQELSNTLSTGSDLFVTTLTKNRLDKYFLMKLLDDNYNFIKEESKIREALIFSLIEGVLR